MTEGWLNRDSRRRATAGWPRFRLGAGPMRWWWAHGILFGLFLGALSLLTGELSDAVRWGVGGFVGGLIGGGVKHLAWLRRAGTPPDGDRLLR